jgi:hypothetical protein
MDNKGVSEQAGVHLKGRYMTLSCKACTKGEAVGQGRQLAGKSFAPMLMLGAAG